MTGLLDLALWRVVADRPQRLPPVRMPLERRLEDLLVADLSITGRELLLVGRQVQTDFGKVIDLVAIDADAVLHVLELKRDRTPRDVVAQVLEYGVWAQQQDIDGLRALYALENGGVALDEAFERRFDAPPPEEVIDHRLTIVASEFDDATSRIVEYLSGKIQLDAIFFRYFEDGDSSYLARTYLNEPAAARSATAPTRPGSATRWNERDWYVSFGEVSGRRAWSDARTHGFVSAGGGAWYSRSLLRLSPGDRVSACVPSHGYVGVGIVRSAAVPFEEARTADGQDLKRQILEGSYGRDNGDTSAEDLEYVVGVEWLETKQNVQQAVWRKGMFANQNSACHLRQQLTLTVLAEEFPGAFADA